MVHITLNYYVAVTCIPPLSIEVPWGQRLCLANIPKGYLQCLGIFVTFIELNRPFAPSLLKSGLDLKYRTMSPPPCIFYNYYYQNFLTKKNKEKKKTVCYFLIICSGINTTHKIIKGYTEVKVLKRLLQISLTRENFILEVIFSNKVDSCLATMKNPILLYLPVSQIHLAFKHGFKKCTPIFHLWKKTTRKDHF